MVERSETVKKMAERSEAMVGETERSDVGIGAAENPASNPPGALANGGLDAGRDFGRDLKKRDPEVVPKAQRRTFTAAYKLKILREVAACKGDGDIGSVLRREGLYWSQLTDWRQAIAAGLEPQQRGPKAKPVDPNLAELKTLRKENAKLQRRLAKAELVIDIQKKVAALLGIPLAKPDFDEDD